MAATECEHCLLVSSRLLVSPQTWRRLRSISLSCTFVPCFILFFLLNLMLVKFVLCKRIFQGNILRNLFRVSLIQCPVEIFIFREFMNHCIKNQIRMTMKPLLSHYMKSVYCFTAFMPVLHKCMYQKRHRNHMTTLQLRR